MTVDFLIIGQGISGTWLSYWLEKEKKSFLVIDNDRGTAPSRLAAGIINPVTGRRHVETWMAGQLLPFAWQSYEEIGELTDTKAVSRRDVIDFFPSPQMRLNFQQRADEGSVYLSVSREEHLFSNHFDYAFGCGTIHPVYTVHLDTLLPAWRQHLQSDGRLLEEEFEPSALNITAEQVYYKDIHAAKVIFCDGENGQNNPWFRLLPFAPNKGEALTLEIPDLPPDHIYKKTLSLVPLSAPGQWWLGASYEWDFKDRAPTTPFRQQTEQFLRQWLKIPFRITGHLAGIRPATIERRPFVGLHPLFPAIGILNGMGTKGCSLAPYFARELTDHLLHQHPLNPEADIRRFSRILQRP